MKRSKVPDDGLTEWFITKEREKARQLIASRELRKSLMPSEDYLQKRAEIVMSMLKKMGIYDEFLDLAELQKQELERIESIISEAGSFGKSYVKKHAKENEA